MGLYYSLQKKDIHASFFFRYFATEFDWSKNVVTIRQLQTMTKFDKWWMSKCMCIEGTLYIVMRCLRTCTGVISNRQLLLYLNVLTYIRYAYCYVLTLSLPTVGPVIIAIIY